MKIRFAHKKIWTLLLAGLVAHAATRALAQSSLDFGDAPAPYPTLLNNNGPRHTAIGPRLGPLVDTENDGLPQAFALGDDSTATDDEDGVIFLSTLVPGQVATVQVEVVGAQGVARLDAWIDFTADGSWAQAGDRIFSSQPVTNGLNVLTFAVPAAAKIGATFSRFRISANGDLNFTGAAANGEVEDHRVGISEPMDFGDARTNNYPTLLSQNGARHRIIPNFMLGTKVDAEPNGQPSAGANGDDVNPPTADDEDGVIFIGSLIAGQNASVEVMCTMNTAQTGRLNAWMDFNLDGDWNDPGEQIFTDVTVVAGINLLNFPVPASAAGGNTMARFRLSINGKIGPGGFANDGEVEDYQVNVTAAMDYGDAPTSNYPTLLAQNGARHVFDRTFCLGQVVDGESNGQPNANASGDDISPAGAADDEDGVSFVSGVVPGQSATVQVFLTAPAGFNGGILNAWLDFNRDGDWADPGEQIFTNRFIIPGFNSLTFLVPANASSGGSFARFRLNQRGELSFVGPADDGEVEDYPVNVGAEMDFGDARKPYPTLLEENGARHIFVRSIHLGPLIDSEPDGQPDNTAIGDDINPPNGDDEDGVVFVGPVVIGGVASIQVTASVPGLLHAWVDFNANGSWADAGEKIYAGVGLAAGVNNLNFPVPLTAKSGRTISRFRFTTQTSILDFVGQAPNGEVEDHILTIIPDRERCDLDCHGREFWLTFPGNYAPDPDNPARLSLCVHGAPGTTANITVPGIGFATNIVVPATQTYNVGLPRAAELGDLSDVVTNLGIHVVASAPVGVQAFDHARFTSDSYLGLHTSVIGTEYIVMGFGNTHSGVPPLNGTQFALVATESNTVVTITPSVTTGSRTAGVPYNLVLQPGEAYQLRNTGDAPNDLSGTFIKSDKPIAVFGSHQNTTIPSDTVWFQDYIVEQLLPVNTWGNDFYTAPLATRSGGDTFRILAAFDNTAVLLNGAPLVVLDRGKFHQIQIAAASRITANRPIFVAQYANSGDFDNSLNADPFMLTVQATRHYGTGYRICTAPNDFTSHFAHIIAPVAFAGTIQIDGAAVGAGAFTAIPGTVYAFARVPVAAGTHRITGGAPFSASVYGWAEYDSYAHPGCFYFGDVAAPTISSAFPGGTASTDDYPNTPGFVPVPNATTGAQVQDNCDQPRTPDQTPVPGTLLPPGVHTVTLSVADVSGNIGQTNVTFTVVDPSPVTIECPKDILVNCTSSQGAVVNFQVNGYTTYETNVSVVSTPASGSLFPPGETVVNSVATSLAGNTNICSFTVKVVCQGSVSVSQGPGGITLTWTGSGGTLERAPGVNGPWTPVVSGVNTYTIRQTEDLEFFRVRH